MISILMFLGLLCILLFFLVHTLGFCPIHWERHHRLDNISYCRTCIRRALFGGRR
jgi:hypothetical protein